MPTAQKANPLFFASSVFNNISITKSLFSAQPTRSCFQFYISYYFSFFHFFLGHHMFSEVFKEASVFWRFDAKFEGLFLA